tara:strand:+ start:867 stop:1634 length:768 start_codon:yes stop_codon:yes gene_type:complete
MQANYGENEIKSLLQKVRIFNKDIGSYEVFAITDNFDYAVKLSNGRVLLKIEELQDDERDALTPERLTEIANRFVSSTGQKTNTGQQNTQATQQSTPAPKETVLKKKNKTGKTILIIAIVLFGIFATIKVVNNMNYGGSGYNSGDTYQEKVMTVEEIERSQPINFLSADGTYRENFWGDKFKVSCTITNTATVATYKDAVVRVTYYTKTKTVLGSNDYTVYETFPPTSTKTVEFKIDNYKNVNSIGWDIINAEAY